MHYLLFIYFNNKPLHISSKLPAQQEEDQLCINSSWYSHALCWLAAGRIGVEQSRSAWWWAASLLETCRDFEVGRSVRHDTIQIN